MLAHSKKKGENETRTCALLTKLSDCHITVMLHCYIAEILEVMCFIEFKQNTQIAGNHEGKQTVSIPRVGKSENQNPAKNHELTSSLGQGGLWAMMKNAQASFERTEHYFRAVTSEAHLHKIDFTSVISRSVRDADVVSAYMQLSVILF